jgi:galactokinase/mevalonate kinase-like predicted kinase
MFLNNNEHLEIISKITQNAEKTYNAILEDNFEKLGECINQSWELNQNLDEGTNPPEIHNLLTKIEHLLIGKKLLGAGGGGYLLMLTQSNSASVEVKKIVKSTHQSTNARFVELSISKNGFEVSTS